MALVGELNGTTYRLISATFQITGPTTTSLDTDTDPDATVLSATLSVGDYSILLVDGWVLQRLEGTTYVPEAATLISPNPASFSIVANTTTGVVFLFEIDGGTVPIGDGTLDVTIDVVRRVCGNGIMEGTEQCDDGNAIDGDGCSATCTIELGAIGAACTADTDCTSETCTTTWPGGYCIQVVTSCTSAVCPEGSACVEAFGNAACFDSCSSSADCRAGYTCTSIGGPPVCAVLGI